MFQSRVGGVVVAIILAALAVVGCAAHRGPVSPHFDGTHFFNAEPDHTVADTLKWFWEMDTVPWPEWIEDPAYPPPPERVGPGALRVTYINHATVLIQVDGLNVLTDPIWSAYAGPVSWLSVRRVHGPGLRFEALPPIDVVLITHDHYDHLDVPTLRRLARGHRPAFIAGLGVAQRLQSRGIGPVVELDWWQEHRLARPDARIVFVPARHGSGRMPFAGNLTLWGGFVIDTPGGQVYFAGDTGRGRFVEEIAARFARIRLGIFPIGNYEKRWFMQYQHLNPQDAVEIHGVLRAGQSMGMHYGTFAEHPEQTIDAHEHDLAKALAAAGLDPGSFWVLGFGEGRDVAPLGGPEASPSLAAPGQAGAAGTGRR